MKQYDLHERLIDFAVMIIEITDNLKNSKAANHLSGQVVRSGTSPSLNYSEAQSAESRNDFIHKMSIVLKELRETHSCLKIIQRASLYNKEEEFLVAGIKENNELISIFVKSIETSKSKLSSSK
ncbi:four helix bundle protein [Flavobacterium sp. CG_9.1]|uniref:Four helix bundle protein n=1 Tax=Flavobacterium xanthum TaxID=69322 RepID=A0A1M7IM98_9FLAO|nr:MULTISPECIES: four helix bundle protein [Flavobacterium]MBG6063476.1 four helix bundle protein [Flavobacterium sp. CG_9.1]SHM41799.1 four helix bundle protein [Flavobacterium xanthum]